MRARAAEWRRRARLADTDEARTKMDLLAAHYEALADQMALRQQWDIGREGS